MCDCCGSPYAHKDQRTVTYRFIFGRLALPSLRWFECSCKCERVGSGSTFSPLTIALPERVNPQLEQLQVKFAAHLAYAWAVEVLQELLRPEPPWQTARRGFVAMSQSKSSAALSAWICSCRSWVCGRTSA